MLADCLKLALLVSSGCLMAAEPASVVASQQLRQPIPQLELDAKGKGSAVIFIGGFGDEISGIVPQLMEYLPRLDNRETRAYYHWHAGCPQDCDKGASQLTAAIDAYRKKNKHAAVVLIGHSMGASMALRVAEKLSAEAGDVFLVTLDPADRSWTPKRPTSVSWWGNAYVVNSQSGHDYIAALGGRWNACRGADVNLCFDGREADEAGFLYIHDNAISLMLSRAHGKHASLYDALSEKLRKEENTAPAGDKPRQPQSAEQADTRR